MSQTNGTNGVHTNGTNGNVPSLPSAEEFVSREYDFVIVGGGTAGLCVAARLTENPNLSVAVLEAGKNRLNDPTIDIPAMHLGMLNNPEYDYMYHTEPQKANHNKVFHYPRGKVLGGSSAINYMMYVRGSDADYDDWAELSGDSTWGSAGLKTYFRKHQTLEPFDESITERGTMPFVGENHGTEGPVRTGFNDFRLPIDDFVIKAADNATGLTKKPMDPWSGDHIGFYNTLGSVIRTGPNRGKRSYSARGYYEPNQHRPNLKLLCEATVERIELDGDRATGVTFTHNGQTRFVKAAKEVIVTGGAFNTPQILEISGIGNPDVLRAAGVEPRIENRAVGENFQDHVLTCTGHTLKPGTVSAEAIFQPEAMAAAQKMLVEKQCGPLTAIASTQGFFPQKWFCTPEELQETIAIIRSEQKTATDFQRRQLEQVIRHLESDTSANLQLVLVPTTPGVVEGWADQSKLFAPPSDLSDPHGITLALCFQYPASRGSVHIKSADPRTAPSIDPAFLSSPADIACLAAAQKFADRVAKSSHLAPHLAGRIFPPSHLDPSVTADAKEAVAGKDGFILSEYHPCGSCAMGDALDSNLLVKGTKNIRVADASAFPNNVSGNICSSVYVVAEKASDIIKGVYA